MLHLLHMHAMHGMRVLLQVCPRACLMQACIRSLSMQQSWEAAVPGVSCPCRSSCNPAHATRPCQVVYQPGLHICPGSHAVCASFGRGCAAACRLMSAMHAGMQAREAPPGCSSLPLMASAAWCTLDFPDEVCLPLVHAVRCAACIGYSLNCFKTQGLADCHAALAYHVHALCGLDIR